MASSLEKQLFHGTATLHHQTLSKHSFLTVQAARKQQQPLASTPFGSYRLLDRSPNRPTHLPYVQRHARGVDQRLEKVLHQLRLVAADALRGDLEVVAEVGPPRQVKDDLHQGLV